MPDQEEQTTAAPTKLCASLKPALRTTWYSHEGDTLTFTSRVVHDMHMACTASPVFYTK